jgi:DNA-binding CsgD family transcriptional regulator/GAF domain-containing protein
MTTGRGEHVVPAAPAVLTGLAELMERLRTAGTTAAVLARAPHEVARLGYDRCMVSRVHQGRWIAESSYVRGDVDLAHAMTAAGSESPVELDRELVESEIVRRRSPMLIRDAQRNPRTHRRLIDLTGTTEYAAAPVVLGRSVVGFVHIDRNRHTGSVDEGDLAVLGLVSQCLGYALERAIQRERLQALRSSIAGYSSSVMGMLDGLDPDLDDAPVAPPRVLTDDTGVVLGRRARGGPRGLGALTARELEVLERVAAGESNADIAAGLFITEATVKAHVKHIFRKLGVANRAEAVSRYLRA